MKILLTGANGQVAREIASLGRGAGHEVYTLNHANLDITDAEKVRRTIEEGDGELVINAAAYTAVDRAEQESEAAFAVNRDGPAHLASACAHKGIPLFHISTDYVFDGTQEGPYREDDPAAPLGVYGRSKWEGEETIRQRLPAHLILRVSWIFGTGGQNFVKTILRLAREREELRVVADQRGRPTYAGDIADVLVHLTDRLETEGSLDWGTYHYAGAPTTTWHGFAETILERARAFESLKAQKVVPIATEDFPTPAKRPANSILDCTRIRETYGIEPSPWERGLDTMLRALHAASFCNNNH